MEKGILQSPGLDLVMRSVIINFHKVQETGLLSLFQNLDLDKASTNEKGLDPVNFNVYAKCYQHIPRGSRGALHLRIFF